MAGKLSKNLLKMKFMQRVKEKVEAEEKAEQVAEAERKVQEGQLDPFTLEEGMIYDEERQCIIGTEPCWAIITGSKFNRMSFRGANPEIERLMREKDGTSEAKSRKRKSTGLEEDEDEVDVSLKDMVRTKYSKTNSGARRTISNGPATPNQVGPKSKHKNRHRKRGLAINE